MDLTLEEAVQVCQARVSRIKSMNSNVTASLINTGGTVSNVNRVAMVRVKDTKQCSGEKLDWHTMWWKAPASSVSCTREGMS